MRRAMKWLTGIVGLLVLLVVVALIIPFLVDFNHFKPQIQAAVESKLNAKIDFESARLQIIPALGVKLTKVSVVNTDGDFNGERLFYVDDVMFRTELRPLFQKRFVGRILIKAPDVVIARKGLKNNIASLPKGTAAEEPKPAEPEKKTDPKEQEELMRMIKESVLVESFEILDAGLRIKDVGSGGQNAQPVKITNFDLRIKNIGLDRDIVTELSTQAAINEAGAKVIGPLKVLITKRVTMSGEGLQNATFDGKIDLDQLDIDFKQAFVKPKGTPLNVAFKGNATMNSLLVEDLKFNLHNVALASRIDVKDFKTLLTEATASIKNDDLTQLGDLLPQHKHMLMQGKINLSASVAGPLSTPNAVKAKADLATQLTGSDLALQAGLDSLEPPRANVSVVSNKLDLGALLKPFMPPEGQATATPLPTPKPEGEGGAPAEAKDFELTPEQKKMLAGADVRVKVSMKEFLFDKIKITDFVLDAVQKDLTAQLATLRLNGFGGTVDVTGNVDLGTSPISFRNDFALTSVHAEQLVEFVKPEHKDVIKGLLSLKLGASGRGTTLASLSKTLNGKGVFDLKNAELHTASIAERMQQQFDQFVSSLSVVAAGEEAFKQAEKLLANPLLKQLPAAQSFDVNKYRSGYASITKVSLGDKAATDKTMKDVTGGLEIKDGRIYLRSSQPQEGGVFNFDGSVGLDLSLGGGAVYVASEGTKARMTTQSQYASLLFDEKKALSLDMTLGGSLLDPKVGLNLAPIQNRFMANARALVDKEVRQGAQDFVTKLVQGKKDAAMAELKKHEVELRAKADAEAAKAKALADAEAQKAKDKAAAEAQKAVAPKAKEKLKGLFGR